MSNLNKAFIEAYRKSAAHAAPAAPHPTKVPTIVAAPAGATLPVSATAVPAARDGRQTPPAGTADTAVKQGAGFPTIGDSASLSPPTAASAENSVVAREIASASAVAVASAAPLAPATIIDTAHVGIRAPHANFVDAPPSASVAAAQAPSGPAVQPAATPAAVEAPPINPRPVILPMTGPSPIWRPVFEVTNFTWPELAGVLLDAASAQFQAAATELADACRRHRKLVAVTAAHRGEGCTVVAIALAKALADEQQRVILVDAHYGAPAMAHSLGLAPQVGWEDVLSGEKPLTEALVESLEDGITVLPLRQPASEDWRLSVARLKASFDELRRHCDLVLVDAGPLGEAGDRRHLLSWAAPCRVDRALVVRDLRATGDGETSDIEKRLHGCGIAQWNFVENFAAA
jgi:Mrp family chromosome partitioning ATPase